MKLLIPFILSLSLTLIASGWTPANEQQDVTTSLYKDTCCNGSNSGKVIKFMEKNLRKYLFCPINQLDLRCPSNQLNSSDLPANCTEIFHLNPEASSGYYKIKSSNGSVINVFCDMEGDNCDQEGGWTRVAYLNMTDPGATCPEGLRAISFSNIDHQLCGKEGDASGCSSVNYTPAVKYTKVCGQARGYQYGSPDGTGPYLGLTSNFHFTIDQVYVDGVSITYGTNPRKHLWTYIGAVHDQIQSIYACPCNKLYSITAYPPPLFIGQDYYCESGSPDDWDYTLYANDPLWDGKLCSGPEEACCNSSSMPWFTKTLDEEASDPIEVRLCRDEAITNEDVLIDIFELFVK